MHITALHGVTDEEIKKEVHEICSVLMTREQWVHSGESNSSCTSFPLVSPFSIHSTVTLSLSSCSDVTIAWWIRPAQRGSKDVNLQLCAAEDIQNFISSQNFLCIAFFFLAKIKVFWNIGPSTWKRRLGLQHTKLLRVWTDVLRWFWYFETASPLTASKSS